MRIDQSATWKGRSIGRCLDRHRLSGPRKDSNAHPFDGLAAEFDDWRSLERIEAQNMLGLDRALMLLAHDDRLRRQLSFASASDSEDWMRANPHRITRPL